MIWLLAQLGCAWPVAALEEPGCDPRTLRAGEVRARRVPCTAELGPGGDARVGDWLLENARARFFVRGGYASLTRLGAAGGTVVDAGPVSGEDLLLEAAPLVGGQAFAEVEIAALNGADEAALQLTGTLEDGAPAELRLQLAPDALALRLDGGDGWLLAPLAGSALVGDWVEAATDGGPDGAAMLVAPSGEAEDLGGWIRWSGATDLAVGDRAALFPDRWPDGLAVSGATDGDRVELLLDDAVVAWLPVDRDGRFEGWAPAGARLRAAADGHAAGEPADAGEDLALSLGDQGVLRLRITDEDGRDLPATAWWNGAPWPLPAGGGDAPVGPGEGALVLSAGPTYSAARWEHLAVEGVVTLEAVLHRAVAEPGLLARIGLPAWPDARVRARPEDQLFAERAQGVGYSLLIADDEVATTAFSGHTAEDLLAEAGSRAATEVAGAPISWPWTGNSRRPAHGVVPWQDLSPEDLLAALSFDYERLLLVDRGWVEAAPDPQRWEPRPHAFGLASLDDLPTYLALLDAWVPAAATGPLTWVLGLDPARSAAVDVDAQLVAGATVASNGPHLRLEVAGEAPGGGYGRGPVRIRLQVEAPAWMPLREASLWGEGGVRLAQWTLDPGEDLRLDETILLDPGAWVLASCSGEAASPPLLDAPAWAVSSPLWRVPRSPAGSALQVP